VAQVKGTAMIGAVRFLRKQRERALPLVPAEMHHYLEDRVFESRWYPEEELIPLVRVCAELMGGDPEETLQTFGRVTAQGHLVGGIYSHLGADGDLVSLGIKASALWSSQHDSGKLRLEVESDGLASVRIDGYRHASREMCLILTGYFQQFFDLSNLRNPQVKKRQCIGDGGSHCEWELRWD
jgi:hypothetical protein